MRFGKIVVDRVTVVKFRVDNRGSDGTGCFRIDRPRRRRLEAFSTDSKIIRLISRRVAIFPAAAARQIFDGDYGAANRKKFPW